MSVLNVLGKPIKECSCDPMTGWKRDGFCHTDVADRGMHTVCCVVDEDFLEYSKERGNDLITPMPMYGFPGLKPGDHWCVCAGRWLEAYKSGAACAVDLDATHVDTLAAIPLDYLQEHSLKKSVE